MQTDPIADMLTRIRNATRAKHQRVDVPASKLKIEVARLLKEEGYISSYKLVEDPETKARKALRMMLKYTPNRRSVITGLRRISKLSGVDTRELYKLFPKAPGKLAAKIAGLPKPKGCL